MDCKCTETNNLNCIKIVPIFSNLTDEEMMEIAAITKAKTYKKGEMVYSAGDEGGTLFVLHNGQVKITRLSTNGKEQVIRIVGAGDFLGELSMFSSIPHTDNAIASQTTTMCIIEGEKLKLLMAKYSSIAFKVVDELSRRLEKAENLIESINHNTVEQRIANALITLSEGKNEFTLKATKGDLASQLGMSQETLSRKLTAFQDSGLIALIGQRKIRIVDRQGLEEIGEV